MSVRPLLFGLAAVAILAPTARAQYPPGLVARVSTDRAQYGPGSAVAISMELHNRSSMPLVAQVNGRFEYDIIVRDRTGRSVWQWSRGRRAPRPFTLSLDAGECRRSREIWDGCDARGQRLPAGVYEIEATLFPLRNAVRTSVCLAERDGPLLDGWREWDRPRDRDRDRWGGGPIVPFERGFFSALRCEPRTARVGETVDVTYTVSNQSDATVVYNFNSGRLFDIEARRSGRCIWRYSQNRFYTQAFTDFVLTPGSRRVFTAQFTITRDTAPGDYDLVAYLTPQGYVEGTAGTATARLRIVRD